MSYGTVNPIWRSCWEWTKGVDDGGYGTVYLGTYLEKRITVRATLLSWFLYKKIDTPLAGQICHFCNNRICVNPGHLYWATELENIKYARLCGGYNKKLDLFTATQIREEYKKGKSRIGLAILYKVSHSQICKVIRGVVWLEN